MPLDHVEQNNGVDMLAVEIEQPNYVKNALSIAALGIPVELIPSGTKACKTPNWQETCTTSPDEILRRFSQNPDKTNYASVAKAFTDGNLFLDDDGGIRTAFELAGNKMLPTLKVQTCSNNFHYYYKQSAQSLAFWNRIGQKSYIQESKPDGTGEMWSLRMNNSYVVGPSSVALNHDGVQGEYKIAYPTDPIEIPDDLLEFLIARWEASQPEPNSTVVAQPAAPELTGITNPVLRESEIKKAIAGPMIQHGSHDTTLTKVGGDLRRIGLDQKEIAVLLEEVCQSRCVNYGSDFREMTAKISKSVCNYPKGKDTSVTFSTTGATASAVNPSDPAQYVTPEIDQTELAPRPIFPIWSIEGTSLYDGFVKPVVESSSKNPEFLFFPAVQIFMNYLNDKVRIQFQTMNWNLYVGLVSDPGKFFKSSSCKLAQEYFNLMGVLETYTNKVKNAEGKVIVTQAGSSEGFGLLMQKLNAQHGVMFNDELGKLVAKAGIENSSLPSDLLSFYERDAFGNNTSKEKNAVNFEANTYTFGWLWCTTTRGFNKHWPRLAGVVSGLEDRMFYVVGPEEPRPVTPMRDVQLQDAATKTRQLIDAAVRKGVYQYEYPEDAQRVMSEWDDPRSQALVEKFALYLAIDLGKEIIDDECLERAAALIRFRTEAKAFLAPIEADNQQARVQQEMVRELRANKGKMTYRQFCQDLNSSRHGVDFWSRAYKTMIQEGLMIEFYELGKRGQKKHMVGLPKIEDDD